MTLASGCGSKTLIRAGAGNLKSLVVLAFLAIAAYMTLKGAFAPWRVERARSGAPRREARRSNVRSAGARGAPGAAARREAVAAVRRRRSDRRVRASPTAISARPARLIVGGIVVGAVVVGGWYVSGHRVFAEDPATLEEKFVATNSGRMESYSLAIRN